MSPGAFEPSQVLARVRREVVGLERESEVLVVALAAGRHVVLEGPPGTGKSTLLRCIAEEAGVGLVFVEGNAELTPSRLVGAHDPAMVLQGGYRPEAFTPGPLVEAVRDGQVLYLEELNRIPEESLNVLITALAEGELHVPRIGRIPAAPTFRLIAAMNPFDAIGTARIGQAIYDRLCRISIGYQDEAHEREITERVTARADAGGGAPPNADDVELAVMIARATRAHRDIRTGSSVRGAIDLALLVEGLRSLREVRGGAPFGDQRGVVLDAALAAMSGRIRLDEATDRLPEEVIAEIVDAAIGEWLRRHHQRADESTDPGGEPGKGDGPRPALPQEQGRGRILSGAEAAKAVEEAARRTLGRAELQRRHQRFEELSPELGELNDAAVEELLAEDPDAAAALLAELANATDRGLRARARALATRLLLRMAKRAGAPRRGVRRLMPATDPLAGDVDLELTLARTAGMVPADVDDIVTRRWAATDRAICLLIDRSGSMSGAQVATAALAAASVVVAAGERADCSVVAFAKDAIVLQSQGRRRPTERVLDDLLTLRGSGETDLSLALRSARRELGRATAADRVAVLLSDAKATTGTDPFAVLRGLDRLHVLCTSDDPESLASATALARAGGGRMRVVRSIRDVPAALGAVLDG
jgi:MoxR-like ATPase